MPMPVHVGANSLKKSHHIVILRFSEVLVKGHAKWPEFSIARFIWNAEISVRVAVHCYERLF